MDDLQRRVQNRKKKQEENTSFVIHSLTNYIFIYALKWCTRILVSALSDVFFIRKIYSWSVRLIAGLSSLAGPESNQSDSGQVRLLEPPINHTHSTHTLFIIGLQYTFYILGSMSSS